MRALTTTWLAVAAIGLSLTLQLSDGFYHEPALAWLGFVVIVALLGVAGCPWPRLRRGEDGRDVRGYGGQARDSFFYEGGLVHRSLGEGGEPSLPAVLVVGVMLSAGALVTKPVARYMADPRPWEHPSLLLVVAGMTLAALIGCGARSRRAQGAAALVVLAGGLWIGVWTVRQSPAPHIDVIPVHIDAFAALERGESPYGMTFDDMYAGNEAFYTPDMRDGGKVLFGFPYPPLSLLMAWPGHALFGDLRYSEVLALVLAAGLLVWVRRDGVGLLCAAVLLLAPRLPFHIEQGWTEPFPIALLAATVATALRRPDLAWLPLGLLMASKQHMALALLFAPWLMTSTRSTREVTTFCARAVGTAAAVTLPLALLDPEAFYRSAILLQLREPFRLDSLSFARWFVAEGWALDKHGAVMVSLTAGIVGIALAWWRAPRTPAGFAAGLALTCLLLTAFGKKAFLNYYMLVVAALLVAIAASRGQERQKLQQDEVVGQDASCLPESS